MANVIGNTILNFSSLDSTNNYATTHLSNNECKEGTVIVAGQQLVGRGQLKNSWESEANKNLLLSIVLYPDFIPVQYQFILSKAISLGVSDMVAQYTNNVHIKWPNDIYVGDKKIAGILIENSIMGNTINSSIVGIGLNVNQAVFTSDAPNPVSLFQLLKHEISCEEILMKLLNSMNTWYEKLKSGDIETIDRNYINKLYRYGLMADYKDKTGNFKGRIEGINEIGQLKLKVQNGELRTYHFKEVEFLNAKS